MPPEAELLGLMASMDETVDGAPRWRPLHLLLPILPVAWGSPIHYIYDHYINIPSSGLA